MLEHFSQDGTENVNDVFYRWCTVTLHSYKWCIKNKKLPQASGVDLDSAFF